ncbi:alpha/beta hydrolase [Nocardioides solisilvae]|uniref:alpha/beta hydrolase n=1 Tax=Nocardioides solisilvae TaxID=1542435 RepID=UPI000D750A4C|nr:alpha/beta hydrolase [Nocardioides solisilvae]
MPARPGRPSRRHELLAWALPRVRRTGELVDVAHERARVEERQRTRRPGLPTALVPRFPRRFAVCRDDSAGYPTHVVTPRGGAAESAGAGGLTLLHVHGGGYSYPLDPFHLRWLCRLSAATGARLVLPDHPLSPRHTWRDSHAATVALATRYAEGAAAAGGRLVLSGDSAGGGYALAVAQAMRDAGGAVADRLLLVSPWVDLADTTPDETAAATAADPWLFVGKVRAHALWWAGSEEDLARPEVSPVHGSLAGLPPALLLYGTRDTLAPGCRLLADRGLDAGWDLTVVEEPGLLHVYPLLPFVPEAARARRQVLEFL